jgi:virulence-associated protein VagC
MPEVEHAELFTDGDAQAVRLPPGFRFEGERVRISRSGRAVLLEPVGPDETMLDAAAMFAEIDSQGGLDVFAAYNRDHAPDGKPPRADND